MRFCEFTLPWERIELKSIIKEIKQYTSDFDKYPLYSFTIENGVTPKTDRYERNFLVTKEGDTFKVVPPNTFVMNPMNLRFGAINYSKLDFPVSVSGYYNIFEIENGKNNDFWAAYFLTKSAINLYNSVATGSLIEKKRVHFSQFIGLKFLVPTSKEKEKITYFIRLIDKRLAVQNKIISKYETLIKGLCDLLFSNTTTVISPLKSIATINKGQQINGLALAKTGEYYYLNGGISPSGYVQEYNTSENTISISEGGNSCGFVAYNTQKFWSGGHCYTLKIINTKCRSKFLYFYLKHREKDIMQLRVGSGLPNIQKRSLENFAVALPSVEKQYYIEHILECITAKKEIETDLLGQFQSQKKFLLSKMFI